MCTKKMGLFACVVCGLLLSFAGSCGAGIRYWHGKDGSEFAGEYVKEIFGKCYFRGVNKKLIRVATGDLIESDVNYIRSKIPPEIQVRFSKRLEEVTDYPAEYVPDDDHEVKVTAMLTVKKLRDLPYYGQLRGELYLIAEEVKTDDYRLFAKKGFAVTFPDEGSNEFQTQLIKKLRYFRENDAYIGGGDDERGAHYKGYVVIIEDRKGTRLAFDTDLSWMNEEKIAALRKLPCPSFLNEECKRQSVPHPTSSRTIDAKCF